MSKESACNAGDPGSIPGLGRFSGEGNGNQLQYSGLESSTDRGVWQATVHGATRVGHDLAPKQPTTAGKIKLLKILNIWRLNNTLLNNQHITEEIRKELKICIVSSENENTIIQNQ